MTVLVAAAAAPIAFYQPEEIARLPKLNNFTLQNIASSGSKSSLAQLFDSILNL